MKMGKRLTALLLALVLVLGLAACGEKDGDDSQQLSGTVYVPEFMDVKIDTDYISGGCCDGENIYLLGSKYVEDNTVDDEGNIIEYNGYNTYQIYKISLETKEVSTLDSYAPDAGDAGEDPNAYVNVDVRSLSRGADGTIWVREMLYVTTFDLPEDFDPTTQSKWEFESSSERREIRRQLDTTGNEISRVDLSGLQEKLEVDYVDSFVTDSAGNVYVMTSSWDQEAETNTTTISMADKDLNVLFSVEMENWGELVQLSDDLVGVSAWGETGRILRTIDPAAKDWGKEYWLPDNLNDFNPGSGEYMFYYTTSDVLYGCKQENLDAAEVKESDAAASGEVKRNTLKGEKLFSWSSVDINRNNLNFFTFMPDGRVAAMTRDWSSDEMKMELAVLTPTDASTLPPRTVLTYACIYCNYDVRERIIAYNRANTTHRIEIKDYSEYNTEDDYTAGITKLNTEIMAGQVPDLIQTSSLPVSRYAGKGLLEDLWPYIDKDPDLGRDKLMLRPLEASQTNGKLYQIFGSFDVRTLAGATSVVGDRLSWSLKDMQETLATMPEGCTYFGEGDTKSGMLQQIMGMNLDRYVNWETGECSFNSPDFISALEFCNSFPLEFDWSKVDYEDRTDEATMIQTGMQMLVSVYLSDLQYMQYYRYIFGGDFSFVGYPVESGVGSSFLLDGGMAMSSQCKDKDAAWNFMRATLLPLPEEEYRYGYWGFPINKESFDKVMEKAMTPEYQTDENGDPVLDENGNPIELSMGSWYINGTELEMKAVSQEDYDQFMELYNAIDRVYTYDTEIYDIVNKMAEPYFNGDSTVEEIVNQIQSRVGLYVNEQK